jgi:hypothetical protein
MKNSWWIWGLVAVGGWYLYQNYHTVQVPPGTQPVGGGGAAQSGTAVGGDAITTLPVGGPGSANPHPPVTGPTGIQTTIADAQGNLYVVGTVKALPVTLAGLGWYT